MKLIFTRTAWRKVVSGAALMVAVGLCILSVHLMGSATPAGSAVDAGATMCTEYLSGLGWEVEPTPVSQEQFNLPENFGTGYESYLALQKEAGFDLAGHAGDLVTRYTFRITNYPTGEENLLADLLVWEGQIIGGEIRSADLDGFMESLVYPG